MSYPEYILDLDVRIGQIDSNEFKAMKFRDIPNSMKANAYQSILQGFRHTTYGNNAPYISNESAKEHIKLVVRNYNGI